MTILASWLRINDFYCHMKLKHETGIGECLKRIGRYGSALSKTLVLILLPHEDHQALGKYFLSSLNIQDYTSVPSNCFQHILRNLFATFEF